MTEIIQYIIRFMIGDRLPDDGCRLVGYTSDATLFANHKVVIVPSDFFNEGIYGTSITKPSLPLQTIEGVPFLFGTPEIARVHDTIVIYADLVASAYFLLSRYEEMICRKLRDEHGRFPGNESIPRRAGFMNRPVVDEYGLLIVKWLGENGAKTANHVPFIRNINLTHDVDAPFSCRTWRNVARHIVDGRGIVDVIRDKYKPLSADPYYTFPWLLQQDKTLQRTVGTDRCQSFLFFKAGGKTKYDKPRYQLKGKDISVLMELCREQGATIGLHCSYQAGMTPSLIAAEKKKLEDAIGMAVRHNRHHFLASQEPEDMEYLERAGITDDFTMGYADVAGFRLGTSLPVRFINPVTCRLTSLTLHPLIIMDSTLNEVKYMNLSTERAEDYCMRLVQNIRQVNGELTLLWHNTSVIEQEGYLRELYTRLLIYAG